MEPIMAPPRHEGIDSPENSETHAATSGGISNSSHPPLQPKPTQYSAFTPDSRYGDVNSPTSCPTVPRWISNPMSARNVLPLPDVGAQGAMESKHQGFDTTGQQPPPGRKPRVTATLWEDEGSLCFQVEARGICVARRDDNNMINGTKLLTVAGMTRSRRDGILKGEKVRHVVKIGPMHLKGIWITYDRALDFANKEKIAELLYPLFVQDIGALLYHPTNQIQTAQVMAAVERRKQVEEQNQMRNPTPSDLPWIHHHPSMALPYPQTSLPSHNSMSRPPLDRGHIFPTPPTSGSSAMGSLGTSESYTWLRQEISGPQDINPMAIDTGLNNANSMPTTPASTPPGSFVQRMQSYFSGTQQYNNSQQMFNTQSSQQSPSQTSDANPQDPMYGQANSYPKNEMAPSSSRPSASGTSGEQQDTKSPNVLIQSDQATQLQTGDDETKHEHEVEYTHDSSAYDKSCKNCRYTTPDVRSVADETNLSAEMTGSPNHPPPSGIKNALSGDLGISPFTPSEELVDGASAPSGPSAKNKGRVAKSDANSPVSPRATLRRPSLDVTPEHPNPISKTQLPDDDVADSFASEFLDEDHLETESGSGSDYSDGVLFLEDGHPFLQVKSDVVKSALVVFDAWPFRFTQGRTAATHGDDCEKSSTTGCGVSTTNRGSNGSDKKRPYEGNDDDERGEENDEREPPKKINRSTKQSAMLQVFLACPFAKRNPVKHRGCYGYVLKRIKDVKQHIQRWHQLPIYCGRCQEVFKSEEDRDIHLKESERCEARDDIQHEGVTLSQQSKLSERVSPKMTLEEQWFTIFDVLFPGHLPRPESPYINKDLSIDLEAFQDMMRSDGPSIILSALQRHGIALHDMRNEERDLATLQQTVLREGFQDIAQRWMPSLTQTSLPSPTVQHDSSSISMASDQQGTSRPSGTSSATLVESRRDDRNPTRGGSDRPGTDGVERSDTRQTVVGSSQVVEVPAQAQEAAPMQSELYSLIGERQSSSFLGNPDPNDWINHQQQQYYPVEFLDEDELYQGFLEPEAQFGSSKGEDSHVHAQNE